MRTTHAITSSGIPLSPTAPQFIPFLIEQADFILHTLSPILWCILFVVFMDRDSIVETWFMPLLGVFAAFLANSVPLGGGIIYIPALSALGADISLGAAFTIAVMPVGNGCFGFLRWLLKDPNTIIWESFRHTVFPSWVGSLVAIFLLPKPDERYIKFGFSLFSFFLSGVVLLAVYRGGLKNVLLGHTSSSPTQQNSAPREEPLKDSILDDLLDSVEDVEEDGPLLQASSSQLVQNPEVSNNHWILVAVVSFLGGAIFVPNIGIGPALVTYFILVLLGYEDQRAIVTGIVTGGWVCVIPLLLNIFVFQTMPYKLWVMVLPGVFYGAKVLTYYAHSHSSHVLSNNLCLHLFTVCTIPN